MPKEKKKSLSRVQLFESPWIVVHQAPLSMGLFRQDYWSGLPFPSPGKLPNPGIEPRDRTQVFCIAGRFLSSEPPRKPFRAPLIPNLSFPPCPVIVNYSIPSAKFLYHRQLLPLTTRVCKRTKALPPAFLHTCYA